MTQSSKRLCAILPFSTIGVRPPGCCATGTPPRTSGLGRQVAPDVLVTCRLNVRQYGDQVGDGGRSQRRGQIPAESKAAMMSSLLLNSGILYSGLPMATRSYQASSSVMVREVARFW